MAEYVEIVRSCAAYSRPDLESPELFRLEAGTVAELLRDEDRLFFKAAYGGQPVYIPKECAALPDRAPTDRAPIDDRHARQLETKRMRRPAAPEATSTPAAQRLSQPSPAFSSCQLLARFAVGALLLVIIMDVVAVISGIAEVRLVSRMINGEFVTLQELEDNDNRQAVVGFLQLAVLAVAAILFLVWMYRAHRNLPALGASGLDYSPNWAVGGWFIPIMNLWRPYQVTAEIWKASDPESSDPEGQAWQAVGVSPLVKFWWALWIIGGIIGSIVLRFAFQEPEDLEALRTRSVTFVAADVIDISAAILAILVVWYITSRQDEKNRRLQGVS